MIPLSKTMRMQDFEELAGELTVVDYILGLLSGGDRAQHPLRRWEYALALYAYNTWRKDRTGPFKISDHGCCTGMLAPMMLKLGNYVRMYEVWAWGNQQEYATQQMEMIMHGVSVGGYSWINRPLGQLLKEDYGVDVAFCISTMEHIPNCEEPFRQMCQTVKPGGMIFMTTDSAEHENDHYIANNVRAGTMFNKSVYERLVAWGRSEGFELLGGEADWSWDESCRLIHPESRNGYGFASLAMTR